LQQVRIQIPAPHSEIQSKIMHFFIEPDGPTECWIACGTKFGKTFGASSALCAAAPRHPGTSWRWLAPYYSQSQIGFDAIKSLLPARFTEVNKSSMSIKIPAISTNLMCVHGQKPEGLEGHAIHGYVFDECAKMSESVFYSARTTVTQTRSAGMGRMLGISTPLGRNWFWHKCMEAKEEMSRAKFEKRTPRQIFLTAPTSANPHISSHVIAEAKKALPDRLFRQYYLAEFVDDSMVFTQYRKCIYGDPIDLIGNFNEIIDRNSKSQTVVVGADWARSLDGDYTVFTAIDYEASPPKLVGFQRSRGLNYTEQIKNLLVFCNRFSDVSVVYHDKTGVGLAIDDQLGLTSLPYRGIAFTNASKAEMVTKLIHSFEQQRLQIPDIKQLTHELDVYEMTITSLGAMVFKASESQHDDCVSSLMLSHAAMLQYVDNEGVVNFLDQLPGQQNLIKGYYDELAEEDEDYLEELG